MQAKSLLVILLMGLLCCGFTYAPVKDTAELTAFQYNNVHLGDPVQNMLKNFGKPRYSNPDYQHHTKLTYYYYKDNTAIGVDASTGKVVDMVIKSPYYAGKNDPKQGDTLYKLDAVYGPSKRQHLEGKLYYPYNYNQEKLLFQLDPNTNAVETIRLTTLPVETDDTDYLPDDATSEAFNPLMGHKKIIISPLIKTSFTPYEPHYK